MDNKNTIPRRVKYGYMTYSFVSGKGNTLCYECNPDDRYDDSYGELLIIQYRPKMTPKDRFYVLYHIESFGHYHNDGVSAKVLPKKIAGKNRMATPIWD